MVEEPDARIALIARGREGGFKRGWYYEPRGRFFQADRNLETRPELLDLASPTSPLTFTVVPAGSESRLGVDRDGDGYFDRTEVEVGTDPADPTSLGSNQVPIATAPLSPLYVHSGFPLRYQIVASDPDSPAQTLSYSLLGEVPAGMTVDEDGLLEWTPGDQHAMRAFLVLAEVSDDGTPRLGSRVEIPITVAGKFEILALSFNTSEQAIVRWIGAPDHFYQVEILDLDNLSQWLPLSNRIRGNFALPNSFRDRTLPPPPRRYYRVRLLEE